MAWVTRPPRGTLGGRAGNRAPRELSSIGATRTLVYVAIITAVMWPRYFYPAAIGPFSVNVYTVMSAAAAVGSLIFLSASKAARQVWVCGLRGSRIIVFTFAAFLLWRFAAGISGDDPAGSLAASATNTLYVSSWAFTASVLFTQLHARAALAPAIAIAGCMAGLLAIFEVFTGNTVLNVSGLAGWSRGDPVLFDSLSTPKFREGVQRAQSTFSHPIVFGQFMAAVIPMGLHLILMRRGRNPVLGILLLLFCTVSIYLCNSRSPLFVALASASFYVAARYLYQSGASRNLGLAILAVTAAAVGGLFFVEDVVRLLAGRTSVEAGSSEARGAMIAYGLNAILDRPLVGYGEGRSVYVAGLVGQGDQLTIDNYFLSIAIDFGIPGFVIFSVFSLSVVMGWRNVGGDIRRIEQDMLVAVLAAAFGIMIGQSVISIDENMTYFYLSTGYLIAATGLNRALTSKSLPLARRS